MRIDKFLWCVRQFKTRSSAATQIRNDKVFINQAVVKTSREVTIGDEIAVKRHGYEQVFSVIDIPKSRLGAKLVANYVKEITPKEEVDKKAFLQMARNTGRQRGLGRPTKKDRRDLDELDF